MHPEYTRPTRSISAGRADAGVVPVPRWAVPDHVRPGPVRDAIKKFLTVLGTAGIRPDGATGIAYDPAVLIIDALRKLGPNVTAAQLREYPADLQSPGSSGFYDFRDSPQRGLTIKDTVIVCWDQTKGTWVAAPTANQSAHNGP